MSGKSGDEWVTASDGERYWGRFGAAGVLAYDAAAQAVLLQHRASFSHHGDTWGIPGGARHHDESAVDAAIREAQEEAGIPDDALRPQYSFLLDRGGWTYTTVIAQVRTPFEPAVTDPESQDVAWVPVDEVDQGRELHPGFAKSWPMLRELLGRQPVVVVDVANVMGSVPDGWWKDRRGAATRIRDNVERYAGAHDGVAATYFDDFGLTAQATQTQSGQIQGTQSQDAHVLGTQPAEAFADWLLVVEGQAKGVQSSERVEVVDAPKDGDGAIVDHVARLAKDHALVAVFTSDVLLKKRVRDAGAVAVNGSKHLVTLLKQGNVPQR